MLEKRRLEEAAGQEIERVPVNEQRLAHMQFERARDLLEQFRHDY